MSKPQKNTNNKKKIINIEKIKEKITPEHKNNQNINQQKTTIKNTDLQ